MILKQQELTTWYYLSISHVSMCLASFFNPGISTTTKADSIHIETSYRENHVANISIMPCSGKCVNDFFISKRLLHTIISSSAIIKR